MKKICVLGAGMVGKTMAIDLAKRHEVISVDTDQDSLDKLAARYKVKTRRLDVTDTTALASVIADADIVLSAVPGFLGYQTIAEVLRNKKNLVDISFLPENVSHLDTLAKEMGVTAVMDCGVAPGMPNYMIGYHNELMWLTGVEYVVGGLPKIRSFPFEYKAPFSPCDVIEEYTRPARFVENGNLVIKPAMSDTELLHFDSVGTLEAFNTDGLRSLIYTMKHIPFMKEKTLRYPGHINLIKAFRDAGFLSNEPIEVKGREVIPFEFTSRLLIDSWKLGPEEPEFTIMRVILRGLEAGVSKEIIYDLYDEYDPVEKLSSMARTTGFTATATVEMILEGKFTKKGLFPPELVGSNPGCFNFILDYLRARNINYQFTERLL
ncbi:MAG: saccharopine dehydrogenase C-terminal domain-containing protein [Bacteroidales bacterium]